MKNKQINKKENREIQYLDTYRAWRKAGYPDTYSGQRGLRYRMRKGETLKRCYTTNAKAKYYSIRKYLPKYWWISNFGTLFSGYDGTMRVVIPGRSGKKERIREQHRFTYKDNIISVDPSLLVLIAFGGKASPYAMEIIEERGVKALIHGDDKMSVDLHHERGYVYGGGNKARRKNSDINHMMLLATYEHKILTSMPKKPDSKSTKNMDRFTDMLDNKKTPEYPGYAMLKSGVNAGRVFLPEKFHIAKNCLVLTNADGEKVRFPLDKLESYELVLEYGENDTITSEL